MEPDHVVGGGCVLNQKKRYLNYIRCSCKERVWIVATSTRVAVHVLNPISLNQKHTTTPLKTHQQYTN